MSTGIEWRCAHCGMLLGIERYGRMYLKYKEAEYVVVGGVVAICRRCKAVNELTVPSTGSRSDESPQ